jgi:hypothetical protein
MTPGKVKAKPSQRQSHVVSKKKQAPRKAGAGSEAKLFKKETKPQKKSLDSLHGSKVKVFQIRNKTPRNTGAKS